MEFLEFLINAKKSGYATGGEENEIRLPDGGKQYLFNDRDYDYADTYYGINPFSGQEIVRHSKTVIWAMNYFGFVEIGFDDVATIYGFLKKALQHPDPNLPLRGAMNYESGAFAYLNHVDGHMDAFVGEETISVDRKGVYRLYYHGGTIR